MSLRTRGQSKRPIEPKDVLLVVANDASAAENLADLDLIMELGSVVRADELRNMRQVAQHAREKKGGQAPSCSGGCIDASSFVRRDTIGSYGLEFLDSGEGDGGV